MKKQNIGKLSAIVSSLLLMCSVNAQDTSIPKFNQDFKVSAQIVAGCYLNADNLNFGTLITPITNQSTSAEMRVLCSKNAPYSISVIYSNVGGGNSGSGEYTYEHYHTWNSSNRGYKIYKNGSPISNAAYDIDCYTSSADLESREAVLLYGADKLYPNTSGGISSIPNATLPICSGVYVNNDLFNSVSGGQGGVLKGLIAGEQIKYSLEVPGKNTTWNQTNKYSSSGSGVEQSITMKANIKSSGNPTHRMTPDTYQDVITTLIDF